MHTRRVTITFQSIRWDSKIISDSLPEAFLAEVMDILCEVSVRFAK